MCLCVFACISKCFYVINYLFSLGRKCYKRYYEEKTLYCTYTILIKELLQNQLNEKLIHRIIKHFT